MTSQENILFSKSSAEKVLLFNIIAFKKMLTFCSATIYLCPEFFWGYFICGNNGFVNILSPSN